jgi:hypothetical protein
MRISKRAIDGAKYGCVRGRAILRWTGQARNRAWDKIIDWTVVLPALPTVHAYLCLSRAPNSKLDKIIEVIGEQTLDFGK